MSRIIHGHLDDQLHVVLALYALDLLDSLESAAIRQHLTNGCEQCETELRSLRETIATFLTVSAGEVHPGTELREKVLAIARPRGIDNELADPGIQVWKRWAQSTSTETEIVRSTEGAWQEVHPGVFAKRLYVNVQRDLATMLVRMWPGSHYLPHRHSGPEQCFVLEGDLREEASVVSAGDFQCLPAGSVHGAQWTESGCLLLIVSSLHDELLSTESPKP